MAWKNQGDSVSDAIKKINERIGNDNNACQLKDAIKDFQNRYKKDKLMI